MSDFFNDYETNVISILDKIKYFSRFFISLNATRSISIHPYL